MTDEAARAAAENGFAMVESQQVSEIGGSAHRMVHEASGAKLLFLQNDDQNKAFAIAFKTPAFDDTGVFHILEHSVLNGSDKFPVKEPFVDLLKGSMQTFLNAMTFPDKTMYPVASTNDQDLMNLMDVYLDAVFHPLIYRKRAIFEQEGWHRELAEDAQGGLALAYNGVVFNEMKGALADADSVLHDALSAALFPDTTYRFESGGVPASIIDLTYEGFLDAHRRHYRPDNSYIILYGDVDIARVLCFLDEGYLAPLARSMEAADPISIELQAPVIATGVKREMCTAPDNSCAACGFAAGAAADHERLIAVEILVDALLGSNEAPLKRAILDAQIADDCTAYLEDSVAQPFAAIAVKGLKEGAAERLGGIIAETCGRLAQGGLDRELIRGALSHAEFVMREHDMGYADGVVYAMGVMAGWLYGDDLALSRIRYEDAFADLRRKVEEGYFEELITSVFLENDHYAQVEVVPVQGDADAPIRQRAQAELDGMSADEVDAVRRAEAELREVQLTPDAPEALATLPRLVVSDVGAGPEEPAFGLEGAGAPVLRHHIPTHGIMYAYRYFGLEQVAFEELPFVAVLALLLGKLDTASHTAAQLDLAVQSKLGSLSFFAEAHQDVAGPGCYPKLVAAVSALATSADDAARLVEEVLLTTDFSDADKVRDLLLQRRVAMEQAFATAGHSVATRRAASYHDRAALVREQLGGVDFYRFLVDLIERFDERKGELAATMQELSCRLFAEGDNLLSFTGPDESLQRFLDASRTLGAGREDGRRAPRLVVPEPTDRHEGLVVPADVAYNALSGNLNAAGSAYSGAWPLLARALTYGYLWQEVRVLGGAYGTGFSAAVSGVAGFYSYRDPHVDETFERFRGAAGWTAGFDPVPEEFAGYVVSSVAGMDAPAKPRELMRRQDGMHFSGYSPQMRAQTRQQLLDCTPEQVQALAGALERICEAAHACSVGSRSALEAADSGLALVELVS